MEQELVEDLKTELSLTDDKFNETLLTSKIRNAIREVKTARRYPTTYSDERIERDMYEYYSNCRALALYDYNAIGMEYEINHSETNVKMELTDRNKLFYGVRPITALVL